MEVPSVQELDSLKYSELRKLAKQAGLKANLKADRLLKALKKHFHPAALPEQMSEESDGNCTLSDKDESQNCEPKEELAGQVPDQHGQHNEKIQKAIIPTVVSSKAIEHDKAAQLPTCATTQDNNKEKEEPARLGSARKERKRRRLSEKRKSCKTGNSSPATRIPRHAGRLSKAGSKSSTPTGNSSPATRIPKHAGRLSKAGSKSSTPNFKKLHEAHFKKMESIDKYMERKQKRLDAVSSSINEVKMMAMKSNLLTEADKTPVSSAKERSCVQNDSTLTEIECFGQCDIDFDHFSHLVYNEIKEALKLFQSRFFILSPATQQLDFSAQTPASPRQSARVSTASKGILANKSEPKPFALSVSKMNVRFSETTKDNEHKRSLIKTPARKSSSFETPDQKSRASLSIKKVLDANESVLRGTDLKTESSKMPLQKSEAEENKMNQSATTPFKFTLEQMTTPNSNKKLKFDLQASLARPLGYQPHKGKLKPWGNSKENQAGTRSTVSAMKNNFKQPILPTRDDRRKKHEEDRKNKRDRAIGTRRGVVTQ